MKRIKIIVLLFLIILFMSSLLYAHSGRTDSSGGHYNRSTGEYHYHHGYPAHQHSNGICPYLIDNSTNNGSSNNNSNSNSNSNINSNNTNSTSKSTTLNSVETTTSGINWNEIIGYGVMFLFIGLPILLSFWDSIAFKNKK